jgi:hypothetical protein
MQSFVRGDRSGVKNSFHRPKPARDVVHLMRKLFQVNPVVNRLASLRGCRKALLNAACTDYPVFVNAY